MSRSTIGIVLNGGTRPRKSGRRKSFSSVPLINPNSIVSGVSPRKPCIYNGLVVSSLVIALSPGIDSIIQPSDLITGELGRPDL